jgi:glycosyltransferase involved in cell wall biosynthesis
VSPEREIEVSVVFPCLNEERTIGACIREARRALAEAGQVGEIVVADNGSTDRSREIALAEGARVVDVPDRGYGNALCSGFEESRGRFLVFLDSDLSYDPAHIPRFVEQLRKGADLVMGSRFRGTIHEGAMPPLHRHLGTPVMTRLVNLFFGSAISDVNCGMRGLSRYAFRRLGLRSGGMELASEMILKAASLGLRIVEVPTDLRKDQRGRRPHLRSFRDGWRHLRYMLLFAPNWLFIVPGLALTLGGLLVVMAIVLGVSPFVGLLTCLAGLAMTVLGVQTTLLGVATHGFAQLRRLTSRRGRLDRFVGGLTLEKGALLGGFLAAGGSTLLVTAAVRIAQFMRQPGYDAGQLDLPSTRLALLGTTLFVTGVQIVISSFFLGLFNIESRGRHPARVVVDGALARAPGAEPAPARDVPRGAPSAP